MVRRALALATLSLLIAAPARAVFHLATISEVMSGEGGNANVQFVEIRMDAFSQNDVGGTRLTWFDCNYTQCKVLMQTGPFDDLPNQGPDVRWLMASPNDATFFAATGVHADYYWDNATAGDIVRTCGMVCWGAPGITVPNPNTWNPGEPNDYVDCVAYGGYTGRVKDAPGDSGHFSGTPDTEPAGDGNTMSLTRTGFTNNNLNDFTLAAATPANNGGVGLQLVTSPGPACTPVTTTTTTTNTTTTTTLPAPSKCTQAKFKATGKKVAGKATCHAKAVAKGITPTDSTCLAKTEVKFSTAFAKAETKADCRQPTGDAAAIESDVDALIADFAATLQTSATASKCTSNKFKAAGKKTGEKANCHAKAVSKATAVDSTCLAKSEVKFSKAFAKAEAKVPNDCQTTADAATVETDIDTFIDDLKTDLAP